MRGDFTGKLWGSDVSWDCSGSGSKEVGLPQAAFGGGGGFSRCVDWGTGCLVRTPNKSSALSLGAKYI